MFCDKGVPEGTIAHQVLETSSKFNYQNVLDELMYMCITCCPNIGYAITILSKFSLDPSAFHYKLLWDVSISAVQSLRVSILIDLLHLTLTNFTNQFLILNLLTQKIFFLLTSTTRCHKSLQMLLLEMT